MPDTIIKDWFLVNFKHNSDIVGSVLWGIVVEDRKNRWRPNDFVCTSKVMEKADTTLYRTRNSEYELQGSGKEVTLEAEALLELRRGVSPDEYMAMQELKSQGFTNGFESKRTSFIM